MTVVANMATYPPRRAGLAKAVAQLAPQVDRLNLVLNQYEEPLEEFAAFPNVHQIIPDTDTKDTGKFYPDVSGADYVLMVDDDIDYPPEFVERTLELFAPFGRGHLAGYHGSLYLSRWDLIRRGKLVRALSYDRSRIADFRQGFRFHSKLQNAIVVDQIATCAAIMHAEDFPSFEFMRDSQKFVDVRLARWCFERSITPIALPKPAKWLGKVDYEETIFHGFTQTNPPDVTEEILSYAFKVKGRGLPPKPCASQT
ncbi:hypothetical protein [Rhodovulum sulfidophilum]|uniref:hypothetical protein n=1 Tax=Rhodovulum sulfidophilum TaxID=35806 RepID=UPI001923218B|nr:hypothetical protein [Rhodovulum sulfidophilum]MBL3563051.1 hypothetical protein [Rhodovulum sulfidophilum]